MRGEAGAGQPAFDDPRPATTDEREAAKRAAYERHLQNAASSIDWSAQTNTGAPADLATGTAREGWEPLNFVTVDRANERARLRMRVEGAFHRANSAAGRAERLRELMSLLDANPAVARILELIEETGV